MTRTSNDMTTSTEKAMTTMTYRINPKTKASWRGGLSVLLMLGMWLTPALSEAQSASDQPSPKIDEALRKAIEQDAGPQWVIVRTKSGDTRSLRQSLEAHGDYVWAEHPSIDGLTAQVHLDDITDLAASSDVLTVSSDAVVYAFGYASDDDSSDDKSSDDDSSDDDSSDDDSSDDDSSDDDSSDDDSSDDDSSDDDSSDDDSSDDASSDDDSSDDDSSDDDSSDDASSDDDSSDDDSSDAKAKPSTSKNDDSSDDGGYDAGAGSEDDWSDMSNHEKRRRVRGFGSGKSLRKQFRLLNRTLGLEQTYSDGAGVTVAVIDSGIGETRGLRDRVVAFYDFTSGRHASSPEDDYGHGTHVASLIGSEEPSSHARYGGGWRPACHWWAYRSSTRMAGGTRAMSFGRSSSRPNNGTPSASTSSICRWGIRSTSRPRVTRSSKRSSRPSGRASSWWRRPATSAGTWRRGPSATQESRRRVTRRRPSRSGRST